MLNIDMTEIRFKDFIPNALKTWRRQPFVMILYQAFSCVLRRILFSAIPKCLILKLRRMKPLFNPYSF